MIRNDQRIFLILGALALATIGGVMAVKKSLSHRNNNPGNVEKGTAWKGIDAQATAASPRFAVFTRPEWGFRAIARILRGDYAEGQDTIRSLINEWSPPIDVFKGKAKVQNTSAYVAAVAKDTGVLPDQRINVITLMPKILYGIARHEAGYMPPEWTPAVIAEGIRLEREA